MAFATPSDYDVEHDLACLYRRIGRKIGHCGRSFVEDVCERARDYYLDTSGALNLSDMSAAARAKAQEYAALNGYRAVMRRSKREAAVDSSELETHLLGNDDPAEKAERREMIDEFRSCICAASRASGRTDAKAFWLSWRKEKPYVQISRKLGTSPQSVGRSVRRVKKMIRLLWLLRGDG